MKCRPPRASREAGYGDAQAADQHLDALRDVPILAVVPGARAIAHALRNRGLIPGRADADALHIAIADAHGVEYLRPCNCTHIAPAEMRSSLERLCRAKEFEPPILCTPEELLGD